MDLTTHSNFGSGSELLSQHEAASIVGRDDINLLLNKKVENGEMSQDMAHAFARDAHSRFSISQLRDYAQGATYVCFADMIAIHLFESSVEQTILVCDGCGVVGPSVAVDANQHFANGRFDRLRDTVQRSVAVPRVRCSDSTHLGSVLHDVQLSNAVARGRLTPSL